MDNRVRLKRASIFVIFNNVLLGDLKVIYDIYIKKKESTKSKKTIKHIV